MGRNWMLGSETSSLLRNMLERLALSQFSNRSNKYHKIVQQVSIRVVAGILAIAIFKYMNTKVPNIERVVTVVGVCIIAFEIAIEIEKKKMYNDAVGGPPL